MHCAPNGRRCIKDAIKKFLFPGVQEGTFFDPVLPCDEPDPATDHTGDPLFFDGGQEKL
jgi:hypothetical protein